MPRELPPGIERTPRGFRAYICVTDQHGRHRLSKRFSQHTTLDAIKAWRETARVDLRRQLATTNPYVPVGTGFLADAERYLAAVQALPTYAERQRHIREWAALFGTRPRSTISASEIRTQRDRWLTVGPKCVQERQPDGTVRWVSKPLPLSASAVNHRLRALENLWTVLDGRRAYNPVRDVPEAPTPDVVPRAIPYALIAAILNVMGDTATKVRLSVIAYVGLSHAQLMRVQPEDIDLRAGTLFLRPRRKGHQGRDIRGVTIPLNAKGVSAFRQMVKRQCWGRFSASAMRKAFKRACAALKLPDSLTPYQLRHSYGSAVYAASGDILATGVLLGHRDSRTTQRYTLGAVDPRLTVAITALRFGKARGGVRGGVRRSLQRLPKVPAGLGRFRQNPE
jgi:integrase